MTRHCVRHATLRLTRYRAAGPVRLLSAGLNRYPGHFPIGAYVVFGHTVWSLQWARLGGAR